MKLINLPELIPDLVIDMRYNGTNNIAGKPISDETVPRLDKEAAEALKRVADEFRHRDLRLVIWDAYRTEATQTILRQLAKGAKDHYVLERSNHCKGLGVDMTLAHQDGTLLDMATDLDEFSTRAHSDRKDLSAEQLSNRNVLRQVMEQHGFVQWPYEWWHFDYIGSY